MSEATRAWISEHIGLSIKAERVRHGIAQSVLAKAAGCSRRHLSRVERGECSNLQIQTVVNLIEAMALISGEAVGMQIVLASYPEEVGVGHRSHSCRNEVSLLLAREAG